MKLLLIPVSCYKVLAKKQTNTNKETKTEQKNEQRKVLPRSYRTDKCLLQIDQREIWINEGKIIKKILQVFLRTTDSTFKTRLHYFFKIPHDTEAVVAWLIEPVYMNPSN